MGVERPSAGWRTWAEGGRADWPDEWGWAGGGGEVRRQNSKLAHLGQANPGDGWSGGYTELPSPPRHSCLTCARAMAHR